MNIELFCKVLSEILSEKHGLEIKVTAELKERKD